jgi:hypothetical protein
MQQLRDSEGVVLRLLEAMQATVSAYHPQVVRTPTQLEDLIPGTAFFPGGHGLWRGPRERGSLPEHFPQSPVMFVGHNFDSVRAFRKSLTNGGEPTGPFWTKLIAILQAASLSPEDCFFTNALMGLKPGRATGPMPGVAGYKDQCLSFLREQVEIVAPRAVVALGVNAERYVSRIDKAWIRSRHPSDWYFRDLATRRERLEEEGHRIAQSLVSKM